MSSGTLTVLERRAACRIRALIEERGLRAASRLAQGGAPTSTAPAPAASSSAAAASSLPVRPPASTLGLLLDREGPAELGHVLARLGDAAIVDTRVLLAHRLGADEGAWPPPEDRFASDLLLSDRIGDPWLAALTASAVEAPIPVLLGGHTLVGPGLRLLAEGAL